MYSLLYKTGVNHQLTFRICYGKAIWGGRESMEMAEGDQQKKRHVIANKTIQTRFSSQIGN